MKSAISNFLWGNSLPAGKSLNILYLLFRLHAGLSLALGAGWPKMKAGMAPDWFTEQVAGLGFTFPSPVFWATVASWGEAVGGLCVAIGLLTRFSAVQLAFQFFIIAFVWLKESQPLIGMHYQQLLFWSYVLIAGVGSGRYSVDYFVGHGGLPSFAVRRAGIALMMVLLLGGGIAIAASLKGQDAAYKGANVFAPYAGTWEGTLTYTDYGTGKEVAIPAQVVLTPVAGTADAATVACSFPGEPGKEYTDELRFAGKEARADSVLQWVSQQSGYDDGKLATIRETFRFSATHIQVRKEVSFDGLSGFFTRNIYDLRKKTEGK